MTWIASSEEFTSRHMPLCHTPLERSHFRIDQFPLTSCDNAEETRTKKIKSLFNQTHPTLSEEEDRLNWVPIGEQRSDYEVLVASLTGVPISERHVHHVVFILTSLIVAEYFEYVHVLPPELFHGQYSNTLLYVLYCIVCMILYF